MPEQKIATSIATLNSVHVIFGSREWKKGLEIGRMLVSHIIIVNRPMVGILMRLRE
jgi:hypothetical protein